jgi:hypothetical protein
VRDSEYKPIISLLGLVFAYTVSLGHRTLWNDGQGGVYDPNYGKIFLGSAVLLLAGSIILRRTKKTKFHSALFAYFFILSSFYFVFNVSMKLFAGEELFLQYELVNYMVNSNLLGFLIWYVIFGFFFGIYLKEVSPDDFLSISG